MPGLNSDASVKDFFFVISILAFLIGLTDMATTVVV